MDTSNLSLNEMIRDIRAGQWNPTPTSNPVLDIAPERRQ